MPEPITPREAQLEEQLRQANAQIALLQAKIDLLIKKLFGAKSEKLDPAQLLFLLEGGAEPPKAAEPVAAEGRDCDRRREPAPAE